MASPHLVTRGIVLRQTAVKDADKILTLLTEDQGKAAVIARGARRKSCRWAASAQPLAWSEWTLYRRGEWYYADDAEVLDLFEGLRGDLRSYALACWMAELTEAVAVEEVPSVPLLRHLLNGLYALSALRKPPELVRPAFELRLMGLAGYEPLLDACAYCGESDPAEPRFDVVQGVLRCASCGREGPARSVPLCAGSLAAARRAVYGDGKKLYSYRLGGDALGRLTEASEAFLLAQMDRPFRGLAFYKGLGPDPPPETPDP